ncbi:aminopeptidase RNPEPL1 isoform X2 [Hemiscyllium ocellatum]|uniref:aminopeptidase RNPEPL1 isoform X2 n=1 Tax=Hemiscyllium ocellatum TaxID=170820 RepID=UPI0029661C81|nr:aminopeptidase RNPEPL1 isoform X2 [Hemiscyllium ocellatum]
MAAAFERPTFCCCRKVVTGSAKSERLNSSRDCPVDIASASNFQHFQIQHFHLELDINFPSREIQAVEVLDLVCLQPDTQSLVLDSHQSLHIRSVNAKCRCNSGENSWPLSHRLDPFTEYGSSLVINLPAAIKPLSNFQIIIRYTTADGPAIWWLDPELTSGNSKPFLFTHGHSVCNRSFFPCFDTPAVKSTYSATVMVPPGIRVLMSATRSTFDEQENIYRFQMEYPVPAYLLALVAGDLISADIGPRSRVWAEPCLLKIATAKLNGTVERWLSAAENLFGPYMWERYDVVFLPPSFPIVAMENPCLTFIISCILESDEFLIIDVIHEIAHSWFGNAVTNATWEEMWLSEGLATYAQRRITTETYGVNPSSLMNLFTYEKGFCFVYYLSQLCGDTKCFDSFLRAYVEKFKFTSVVATDLLEFFLGFFPELREKCVDNKEGLEFERWLNASGPPLLEPDLSQGSSLIKPVESLYQLWSSETPDGNRITDIDISKWKTFQIVHLLDKLLDRSPLPHEAMMKLSKSYSALLDSMNAEIRIRWLQIVVRNNYLPDFYKVRRFLENHTSRMYTGPLYEDLCAGTMKAIAMETFYLTQNRLHVNLRRAIQQIFAHSANPAAVMTLLEDKPSDASNPISLRDVNVSA